MSSTVAATGCGLPYLSVGTKFEAARHVTRCEALQNLQPIARDTARADCSQAAPSLNPTFIRLPSQHQKAHDSCTASHDTGRSIWPSDSARRQPCIPAQAAFDALARSTAPFKEATSVAHAFPVPLQQVHRPSFFET